MQLLCWKLGSFPTLLLSMFLSCIWYCYKWFGSTPANWFSLCHDFLLSVYCCGNSGEAAVASSFLYRRICVKICCLEFQYIRNNGSVLTVLYELNNIWGNVLLTVHLKGTIYCPSLLFCVLAQMKASLPSVQHAVVSLESELKLTKQDISSTKPLLFYM